VLVGALAAVLTVTAVFRDSISNDALLPGLSTLFLLLAAAVALIAWRRPSPPRRFSYWDAAGVLTFIGICVAALIEPQQMPGLVAGADRP
jgi:hypothetical protein